MKTSDAEIAPVWNPAAYNFLRPAGLETRDTAGLETCATRAAFALTSLGRGEMFGNNP